MREGTHTLTRVAGLPPAPPIQFRGPTAADLAQACPPPPTPGRVAMGVHQAQHPRLSQQELLAPPQQQALQQALQQARPQALQQALPVAGRRRVAVAVVPRRRVAVAVVPRPWPPLAAGRPSAAAVIPC